MTVHICDRCGDITVNNGACLCATPCDPVEVRRRHRDAVARARTSGHPQASRTRDVRRAA